MKKLALAITMALTFSFISCNEDVNELNEASADLKLATPEIPTNIGTYKGIFTTNDSEFRGIVEIEIADTNVSPFAESIHKATITMQNGDIAIATSSDVVSAGQLVNKINFSSNDISFTFSVHADGSEPKIKNVVYKNVPSDVLIKKHTSRAPVSPINGTFTEISSSGYPGFGGAQTFNMMFAGSDITTQVVINGTSHSGAGYQEVCNVNGVITICNILSGTDSGNRGGFVLGGADVTWEGTHEFNNEDTMEGNDCSSISGIFSITTASWGVISGAFVEDAATQCPAAPVVIYEEDFQGFEGAGFSPTPTVTQLDSNVIIVNGLSNGNLAYGGTETNGDFARGLNDGGISIGGIYAFDIDNMGDIALGVQPTGNDFTPGYFEIRTTNNTGNTITEFNLAYDGWVFNDEGRSSSFTVSYSIDGINFIELPSLSYTSPEAPNPPTIVWAGGSTTSTDFNALVADGGHLYIRFASDDVGGSGRRDEFAINDIVLTKIN